MEASEATETAEATEAAPQTDPTTDAPAEAAPEATEGEEQQAPAPQLGDVQAAINSGFDRLARKIEGEAEPPSDIYGALTQPEPEYEEPEGEEGQQPQQPQAQTEDDQLESTLRELMREEAMAIFGPYAQQQEAQRRANEIRAFAEQNPRLNEPEVMQAVSNRLHDLAVRNQNPALQTDPALVELAFKAYVAEATNETPAEAAGQGATLEAGAGPSAPTPDLDPVQQEYTDAFAPGGTAGDRPDPLTS